MPLAVIGYHQAYYKPAQNQQFCPGLKTVDQAAARIVDPQRDVFEYHSASIITKILFYCLLCSICCKAAKTSSTEKHRLEASIRADARGRAVRLKVAAPAATRATALPEQRLRAAYPPSQGVPRTSQRAGRLTRPPPSYRARPAQL